MIAGPPGDDEEGEGATRVFSEGGPGGGGGDEWTVNVTDDDQRTFTAAQIVVEFQRGVVTPDTYVWKDGMADWLPLSDVPELMHMVSAAALRPAASGVVVPGPPPAYVPAPMAPEPGAAFGGTMIMGDATVPLTGTPFSPAISPAAAAAASGAPAAARRSGKAGGVDLFAPGQREAPATSAATTSADRLVGERNENSVLFSLSALTASVGADKDDDPFHLNAPAPARNGRANVDDIMNLGGGMGGMAAPMLAPPPLLAPVVEAPPPPPPPRPAPMPVAAAPAPHMGMNAGMPAPMMGMTPDYPQPKSKTPLILGIGGAVVLVGIVGIFLATRGGTPATGGSDTSAATTAPAEVVAAATTQAAEPTPPPDTAKPADTAPAGTTTTTPAAAAANPGRPVVGGPGPGRSKPEPEPKPEAKPPDPPPNPKPAKTADAKPPDTGGGGKDFDRGAASSALSAAGGAARGCKKEDGPTGTARVRVTFAPSGSVTSSSVDGAPFAGTAVGGCIAAAFRGAHVPAFEGSPVTVTKSVTIN